MSLRLRVKKRKFVTGLVSEMFLCAKRITIQLIIGVNSTLKDKERKILKAKNMKKKRQLSLV